MKVKITLPFSLLKTSLLSYENLKEVAFFYFQNGSPLEGLRSFYIPLLNHTAYVFFISEQTKVYSHDHTCTNPGLYENSKSLATEMQTVMCAFRYCMANLADDDEEEDMVETSTNQILSEELSDHSECSKRAFRDCQTIRSTVEYLRELIKCLGMLNFDSESDS